MIFGIKQIGELRVPLLLLTMETPIFCQTKLTPPSKHHYYLTSLSYSNSGFYYKTYPNKTKRTKHFHISMSFSSSSSASNSINIIQKKNDNRRLPVLLFDIMDTIVRDPFYHDVPPFFRMSFQELIDRKHPTAWYEFETGEIDEMELSKKFFKDGSSIDLEGLKNCMRNGYSYLDGIEQLLSELKQNEYRMHACTNYPVWYQMIEEKLKLSTYLSWTFCSCFIGKRKPDPEFFLEVLRTLQVDPASCIFIDDRLRNVEAAVGVGMIGLQFKNSSLLREDLLRLGIDIVPHKS